eukprot:XP_794100.4 PREDICTED: intestinal-type alkaline phosphatase [Strongylocentrotus purpuratus]
MAFTTPIYIRLLAIARQKFNAVGNVEIPRAVNQIDDDFLKDRGQSPTYPQMVVERDLARRQVRQRNRRFHTFKGFWTILLLTGSFSMVWIPFVVNIIIHTDPFTVAVLEMISISSTLLILGGGRVNFLPNTTLDPEYGDENTTGYRTDGLNLIEQWLSVKGSSAQYVWNKTALDQVDLSSTKYLLGLFEPSHMKYEVDRQNDTAGEPSIAEMTELAINMLSNDEDGFFLMVESGRIDHGHHEGVAHKALTDTIAFHDAVAKAVEMTDSDDTLILVTADHGHAFVIGGYASRGNPIFGYDDRNNGSDDKPYLTLSYANGPGGIALADSYINTGARPNHYTSDYDSEGFVQDATVPAISETHGGTDVAIYAHGPWSHLFHGTHEQNYIPHVVRYAACYSDNEDNACTRATEEPPICTGSAHPTVLARCASVILPLISLIFLFISM